MWVGKSIMAQNILVYYSLKHKKQTSIYISPTFAQAREQFTSICDNLTKSICQGNSSTLEIRFVNGSRIKFLSAESKENIRGYTVTKYGLLVVDEAAYISDDAFYAATPFVNANKAPTLIISTPRFKDKFFYTMFNDPDCYTYDWAKYKNPFIDDRKLEMYRRSMPTQLFKADYLGMWMESTSQVFGDFSNVLSNYILNDTEYYYAGLDWGSGGGSDYTVLTIFNSNHQMVYLDYFNDVEPTEQIGRIVKGLNKYRVKKLIAEKNSIGEIYLSMLKKQLYGVIIEAFDTTNTSKRAIIDNMIAEIRNGQCTLLNDTELKVQLSAYEVQQTKTGITYNAASGYHDDICIASALGLWCFKKGNKISYV